MSLNIAERSPALAARLRDPRIAWWAGLWLSALLTHALLYAIDFYAQWPNPQEEQIASYFMGYGRPLVSSFCLLLMAWWRMKRGADGTLLAERTTTAHLSLVLVLILLAQDGVFIPTTQQTALLTQQPALTRAWLLLTYSLLLILSWARSERRHLALALSGALSLALLAWLAMPIMQRSGRVELSEVAWFEWQATSEGCTAYRFSGRGLQAIWLGDDGLAGIDSINEGLSCAAAPAVLYVLDEQGMRLYLVGNTTARAHLSGWWAALLAGSAVPWLILYGGALRQRYGLALAEAAEYRGRAALALFVVGLFIFYGLRLASIGDVMSVRSQPPETDDSYAYIWMSFRLLACMDCAALARLRQDILTPSDDPKLGMIRWRRDYLGSLYAPLQSALLALLRLLSHSWEATYSTYMLVSMLLAGIALSLFLYSLIGTGPAALALILLALLPWSVRVPPSTLALLIALIAWGLAWRQRLPTWAFLLLIGLLLLSHTIGRLYGLVFIALHSLSSLASTGRLPLARLLSGGALIGLYWLLAMPISIDSPLSLPEAVTPYWATALSQLHHLVERMLSFAQASLGDELAQLVLGAALILLPAGLRLRWLTFALVFGPLLLASVFYVSDFMNDLANRLLVVYRYLPTALLAFLTWGGLSLALRRRNIVAGALALVLMVLALHQHIRIYVDSFRPDSYAKTFQNYAFNREGLQTLLEQARPGDAILYNLPPNYDALLPYALVNGAHQHPAIFLPMLDAQQRQADEIRQACWMIAYTPGDLGRQNGVLQLRYEDGVRASLDQPQDLSKLQVLIPDSPRAHRLVLSLEGADYPLDVPAHSPGWRTFPVSAGLSAQVFTLHRRGGTEADGIMGLRFGDGPLHWAWEEGLQLDFGYVSFDGRRDTSAVFRLETLLPSGWEDGVILDDSSDLLAVRRAGCSP
ncbi:MAG: hypothetical protein NZ750_03025 [Anaerolineae bacterium]|nr:hypothetical protein [Anaerolineae bacterium]MDW8172730.1 hypothetical protein [Anaerolineae bacterium]